MLPGLTSTEARTVFILKFDADQFVSRQPSAECMGAAGWQVETVNPSHAVEHVSCTQVQPGPDLQECKQSGKSLCLRLNHPSIRYPAAVPSCVLYLYSHETAQVRLCCFVGSAVLMLMQLAA